RLHRYRAVELIGIINPGHLNRGFVYQQARGSEDRKGVVIEIRPRRGSTAICSGCHKPAPGYDHLPERIFEFIPLWGMFVFFLYRMRRFHCLACGAVVEEVPWPEGKRQLTRA